MLAQLVKRIKRVESSRATNKLSRASYRATSFRSSLIPLTEQSWQSGEPLKEREYGNSPWSHTKSTLVKSVVLADPDIELTVGSVERLLKKSIEATIYSDIPR